MKLPALLSQFLYQTRRLDLPGIGSFTLDPATTPQSDSDKESQSQAPDHILIHFKNMTINNPDDALIGFIQAQTGKMKPLAAADLDFFLTSGKQLLNIGKPFYIEGIGTLLKNKEGLFDFAQGEFMTSKLDEPASGFRERADKQKSAFEEQQAGHGMQAGTIRQLLLLFGVILALVVIGWGGYTLYKRNVMPEPVVEHTQTTPSQDTSTVKTGGGASDSLGRTGTAAQSPGSTTGGTTARGSTASGGQANPPTSSPSQSTGVATLQPGMIPYKFVILETTHKGRALRRYNQLLGFQLNIKMEQKDSSFFKLYFPISAFIRDTTHIKDSLADVYAAHVTIEQ